MNRILKTIPVAVVAVLAACSSTPSADPSEALESGADDALALETRADDALAMVTRVEALSGTSFDAMPISGSASFIGAGALIIDPDLSVSDDEINMLGDATLVADFGASTVKGEISNILGFLGDPEVLTDFFDVGGVVSIGGINTTALPNGSRIGSTPALPTDMNANEWRSVYAGTLTTPEGTFDVSGVLDGGFLGTRVNNPLTDFPIKAIAGADEFGVASRNGIDVSLFTEVVAENSVP